MSGKPIKSQNSVFWTNKSWKHCHSSSRPKPPRCNFNKRQPYRITQKRYWRQWRTNQKGIFLFWCIFIFSVIILGSVSSKYTKNHCDNIWLICISLLGTIPSLRRAIKSIKWSILVFEGDMVIWCIFDPFVFGVWTSDFQKQVYQMCQIKTYLLQTLKWINVNNPRNWSIMFWMGL